MTQEITGAPGTPEPGAIVFLDENPFDAGYTYDEALQLLSQPGGIKMNDWSLAFTAAAAPDEAHTGAMIALVPMLDDVIEMQQAIDPKIAVPIDQLHCTVLFLGEAASIDPDVQDAILGFMEELVASQPIVLGDIFGFNVWNPEGPEPCVVAAVSGGDLEDACMSICGVLDEADIEYPDQHMPWVPHITLAYTPDPVAALTDDLISKTGPITFDRLRVAFAGVTHDFPLQSGVTAAGELDFHLAGKHNQETHGRGGASPGELAASERLAKGKHIDESSPEGEDIANSVRDWTSGGQDGAELRSEIMAAKNNPGANTLGAKFTRTVAAAPAGAPELHRGMAEVKDEHIPHQGDVFDLGPTSFTKSPKVRDRFSQPADDKYGVGTRVHMRLAKGGRAVQTSHYAPKQFADEEEFVAMGRFHVVSRRETMDEVKTRNGGKRTVKTVHLDVVQLDEHNDMPTTFTPHETTVISDTEIYG